MPNDLRCRPILQESKARKVAHLPQPVVELKSLCRHRILACVLVATRACQTYSFGRV